MHLPSVMRILLTSIALVPASLGGLALVPSCVLAGFGAHRTGHEPLRS